MATQRIAIIISPEFIKKGGGMEKILEIKKSFYLGTDE